MGGLVITGAAKLNLRQARARRRAREAEPPLLSITPPSPAQMEEFERIWNAGLRGGSVIYEGRGGAVRPCLCPACRPQRWYGGRGPG